MNAPEDRLIALTYLKAKATQDELTIYLIESTTDPLVLAQECAMLAIVITQTLAQSIDNRKPPKIEIILEDLRDIYYDR